MFRNVSGTLRQKNDDISINNWKHVKSSFTYAVMEHKAASGFLQNDRSKSQARKRLERLGSSISLTAERKSSSSVLLSSTLKAKKPPLLCYKAKEDSAVWFEMLSPPFCWCFMTTLPVFACALLPTDEQTWAGARAAVENISKEKGASPAPMKEAVG